MTWLFYCCLFCKRFWAHSFRVSTNSSVRLCEWAWPRLKAKSFTKDNSWKMLLEDPLAVCDKSQFVCSPLECFQESRSLVPPKIFHGLSFTSRSFSVILLFCPRNEFVFLLFSEHQSLLGLTITLVMKVNRLVSQVVETHHSFNGT